MDLLIECKYNLPTGFYLCLIGRWRNFTGESQVDWVSVSFLTTKSIPFPLMKRKLLNMRKLQQIGIHQE